MHIIVTRILQMKFDISCLREIEMQSDNIMFQVFMWVMLCFSFFQIAASFRLHQPMQHTNWQIVNAVGKELTTRMIPMAKSRKIDVERLVTYL